ncbi:MAG: hypothetical protein CVU48_09460 [Candidatus Cloacimonetes bacterium HGW-Cloacimonetes-1]|jgi:cyclase|nr:MAG: hypothetical protein CVU48_09460 [Candidatus Cloacimonetes bacterium HGW-Cloacimonetes-1]
MVDTQRITDNTLLFTSDAMLVNAGLVMHEGRVILVDSMVRPTDVHMIRNFLEERNLPLDYIVNTHWHSDHCYGNRMLKAEETQCVAHQLHSETLARERNMFKPGKPAPLGRDRVPAVDITFEHRCDWVMGQWQVDSAPLPAAELQIIHAAGHSPDLSYLYLPRDKVLFAGDNVLYKDNEHIALPYFYWDDEERLIQGLKMIMELDVELIVPGHGDPVYRLKIEEDISYLTALQKAALELVKNDSFTDAAHLEQVLVANLDAMELYPDSEGKSIWQPQVHAMNLRRLALKYSRPMEAR